MNLIALLRRGLALAGFAALAFGSCGSACGYCTTTLDVHVPMDASACEGALVNAADDACAPICPPAPGTFHPRACSTHDPGTGCELFCEFESGDENDQLPSAADPNLCDTSDVTCMRCIDLGDGLAGCMNRQCYGG
ncbi:MAG TPA: hypothetical protein VHB21_07455 [Minicystis sp.]|nr:hypothetical protein [Minicystis sp.]